MRLFNALLLCGVLSIAVAADTCGQCMTSNEALCLNETYFQLCAENEAVTAPTKCRSGQVCTNSENICETNPDGRQIINVCKDGAGIGACGTCENVNDFVCVSSTQYSRCNVNLEKIGLIGCPEGEFCSVDFYTNQTDNKKKQMCVPEAVLEFLEFDVSCTNSEVTKPTTTTAAPSTKSLADQCFQHYIDSTDPITDKYFYASNMNDCTTYIYCEFTSSGIEVLLFHCKSGWFYDSNKGKCVDVTECPRV